MTTDAEIRDRMDWMIANGILEVHPDDVDKPWEERRLRRTALGDLLANALAAERAGGVTDGE